MQLGSNTWLEQLPARSSHRAVGGFYHQGSKFKFVFKSNVVRVIQN